MERILPDERSLSGTMIRAPFTILHVYSCLGEECLRGRQNFANLNVLHASEMAFGAPWPSNMRTGTAGQTRLLHNDAACPERKEAKLPHGRSEDRDHPFSPRSGKMHDPGII